MKMIWGIILFLAVFQGIVLVVNNLGVFPNTFYSDVEFPEIEDPDNPPTAEDWFISLFDPGENIPLLGGLEGSARLTSMSVIIGAFLLIGSLIAWKTHSWLPLVVVILGYSVFHMMVKSWSFINKMFTNWDNTSLMYLGLTIGLALVIIFLITILETATHGEA